MTCVPCGRRFGGLTGFDKHQEWFTNAEGAMAVTCLDPATMVRGNGSHLFKQTESGSWVLLVGKKHPHA